MPLPIAHGLLGATLATFQGTPGRRRVIPLLLGAAVANGADFDFALVLISGHREWHRGFSHSIAFAFGLGLLALLAAGWRHLKTVTVFTIAFASHGLLDYVTTKEGSGVELFWPFSSQRMALEIVGLSEVPSKLPPTGIVRALALELMIFIVPFVVALSLRRRTRH